MSEIQLTNEQIVELVCGAAASQPAGHAGQWVIGTIASETPFNIRARVPVDQKAGALEGG